MTTRGDENVSERLVLAFGAASTVAIFFSIAAAQVLLGLGVVALLIYRRWKMPPIWLPLGSYLGWTVLSKIVAEGPWVWNPQIRKFFVFLLLPLVYAGLRSTRQAGRLLLAAAAAGVLSALWSFVQFAQRWQEARTARESFYEYYTPRRTTGFMSHWMTFSGEMLIAASILSAFVLFGQGRRQRWWAAGGAALTGVAIVLNQTRSVWLAGAAALTYLVAMWRPRWLLALPVAAALVFVASPGEIQRRAVSIFAPHGTTDSNQHRYVTWRTGLEMVRAHPLLGVGPHRVDPLFQKYVPASIPRPLPEGWYGHLHNVYLQTAAERGLPALVFLLWLLGKFGWDWVAAARRITRPDERFVLHAAVATLLGTMISGLFEHNLGNSEILHLLLAVAGCAYAVSAKPPSGLPRES